MTVNATQGQPIEWFLQSLRCPRMAFGFRYDSHVLTSRTGAAPDAGGASGAIRALHIRIVLRRISRYDDDTCCRLERGTASRHKEDCSTDNTKPEKAQS